MSRQKTARKPKKIVLQGLMRVMMGDEKDLCFIIPGVPKQHRMRVVEELKKLPYHTNVGLQGTEICSGLDPRQYEMYEDNKTGEGKDIYISWSLKEQIADDYADIEEEDDEDDDDGDLEIYPGRVYAGIRDALRVVLGNVEMDVEMSMPERGASLRRDDLRRVQTMSCVLEKKRGRPLWSASDSVSTASCRIASFVPQTD